METRDFQLLQSCRKNIIELLNQHSDRELNVIPKNFNNSLIWNAGHSLVTQQLLLYYLSGNEMRIPLEWVDLFKKGTRPESELNSNTISEIKKLLQSTAGQVEGDYKNGIFEEYKPYMTSFGFAINSIEDAISFNHLHESLHLGYMMALKKEI